MTREVAIKAIQDFIGWFKEDSLIRKALEMAIKALENHDTFMKYAYSQGKQDALSQEPTEICCATCKHKRLDDRNYKCEFQNECLVEGKRGKYEFAYTKYEPIVEQEQQCTEHPCLGTLCRYYKEPCTDAVSREAVMKIAKCISKKAMPKYIEKLPSVTQKSGKWLYKEITDNYRVTGQCSECKERRIIDNFCPNCGADMREEQTE